MNSEIIKPRILKGFRDSLPDEEIFRKSLIRKLENVFESFGFVPIDTPVLEYTDVLLGKGGGETDKQVYSFIHREKHDISMRFDLTVPFARFMGMHSNDLPLPFKRYHIAKVWRGENTQRGRYREFYQCDFDIVGTDSCLSDAEILLVMYNSFQALGIKGFNFRVNDRSIFNTFLDKSGVKDRFSEILRIVDKIRKIGKNDVHELLRELTDSRTASKIIDFITMKGSYQDIINEIKTMCGGSDSRIDRFEELFSFLKNNIPDNNINIDTSITRGLDYYTGLVYETFLDENSEIGSVCSGGRYDNLASLYTKAELTGVGASIGLDRLIAALSGNGEFSNENKSVIIFNLDPRFGSRYLEISQRLRKKNIKSEVFYEDKKINQQFSYAEKKGIAFAVICGEDEFSKNMYTFKDLVSRKSYSMISFESMLDVFRKKFK